VSRRETESRRSLDGHRVVIIGLCIDVIGRVWFRSRSLIEPLCFADGIELRVKINVGINSGVIWLRVTKEM